MSIQRRFSVKFSGAAIQANDDCAFTTPSTNALTVGEAVLTASALKVNEQVCNADLRCNLGIRPRCEDNLQRLPLTSRLMLLNT